MYIPSHFRIDDEAVAYEMMEKHGFAMLVSQHQGSPTATHLPLILAKDRKSLYGHFARANPQWQELAGQEVLVIFQGPHCYISPSWYETDRAVPTWNYVAVHVYGHVELLQDDGEVLDALRRMIVKYEEPGSPYRLDGVDAKFVEGMLPAIVGFKIHIDRIEGKAKLSQNHPDERQERVIRRLEQMDDDDRQGIATLMQEHIRGLKG